MVTFLLDATAPTGRLWIIGQPANVAAQDVVQLAVRLLLLFACTACR